ncbi:MAG: peptidylprolyl isomerase [Flavobacteriales bacterium]|nr:peptidylprolyl isomerase [Flavobacteriales bacterium]
MKRSNARTLRRIAEAAILLAWLLPGPALAQPKGLLIDRIVAVVGREAILQSDLLARVEQARQQGGTTDKRALECGELEDLLYEKLLVEQGKIDSVAIDEAQVNAELDRRIRYFASQLGGEKKLEEFYGKSVAEIRSEFRDQVHDQLLVQTMQQRLTTDIRITPRDVQKFFNGIPKDSIPFINAEVEWAQLLRIPKASDEEERRVRRKAEEYRNSISNGERDFCTVAILYSEDPGSAKECGELGMVPTGMMVPEFDAVALSLKTGEISQVFRTEYGYHFMELIDRRGEQYNARHVLIRPQVTNADLQRERDLLDSLLRMVRAGDAELGDLAAEWSDDEESKASNGIMIDQMSNSTRWDMSSLDQQTFFVLDKLKPGEVSEPQLMVMPNGTKAYRLVKLLLRTEPHAANLKDDYQLIKQAAEGKMRAKAVDEWVKDRLEATYVRLAPDYANCEFLHAWSKGVASE